MFHSDSYSYWPGSKGGGTTGAMGAIKFAISYFPQHMLFLTPSGHKNASYRQPEHVAAILTNCISPPPPLQLEMFSATIAWIKLFVFKHFYHYPK